MQITQNYIRHLLHYDPDSGIWTWLNPNARNLKSGALAGTRRFDGYLTIRVRGRAYFSGRLAWFYMTGIWPKEIDHKDRNPANDRWNNLREATSSLNKFNSKKNDSLRGVYQVGKKWWIMVGRNNYGGIFDTLEEAIKARDTEALRLAGDFAILNHEQVV